MRNTSIAPDQFCIARGVDFWPMVAAYMVARAAEVHAAGQHPGVFELIEDTRVYFALSHQQVGTGRGRAYRVKWIAVSTDAILPPCAHGVRASAECSDCATNDARRRLGGVS